ncbi:hypothetical protein BH10ACI1_BH10ACI1_12780 [soil metagenome]
MTIASESHFGKYNIISQVGAGGMGDIYLVFDTELERKTALKILHKEFTKDAGGLKRFVQEAKSASALNHPNIITIYEIGEAQGENYIATEFVDGQTLRERLQGAMPMLDEILSIAVQTAKALAAAHQAGIIHRDIKPDNIMIRHDGYVKVLDFGLAKLIEKDDAKTITQTMLTHPGIIMGTPSYMSPEQARGKPLDARSDIFSFGIVLFEMLTRRLPFEGETIYDVMSSILQQEAPKLHLIAPDVPKELEQIVNLCLNKTPDGRYRSSEILLNDLRNIRDELKLEKNRAVKADTISLNIATGYVKAGTQTGSMPSSETNKDALLLTEFDNQTGEEVFDFALKTALAVSLEQSPFLNIFADERVRQTLKLMGLSPDARVTRQLGHEICQRKGLKAFIAGTISMLGKIYILTLEAINAQTDEIIGRQFQQAESKEQVLKALGQAATGLREKLGESLSSIEKYDAALEITTSSLDALKFYSLGYELYLAGKHPESIPFLKRAIALDPNFAYAYYRLSATYYNTNQPKLAAQFAAKAFELCDNVSEREKLRITYFYYLSVTGEIDKAIESMEQYRLIYPHDWKVCGSLADSYWRIGKLNKAIEATRQGLKLKPDDVINTMNLAGALMAMSDFMGGRETLEPLLTLKKDNPYLHQFLFEIAFVDNNSEKMANHLEWFRGQSNEFIALNLQTQAAAFRGEWRRSQELSRRSIDFAVKQESKEIAAQFAADQTLRIIFWSSETGLPAVNDSRLKLAVKSQTSHALRLENNKPIFSRTAFALALAGLTTEAIKLTDEMKTEYPKDLLINGIWLPLIKAAFELQKDRPQEAVEELEFAARFEKAAEFYPQYLRGLAYLKAGINKNAAAEFEKILTNRGESILSALYPLAQLGLARARKSPPEYEKFFKLWQTADKDMPLLVAARKEFSELS